MTEIRSKISFLALGAYSAVGGLQRFNQRVVCSLASFQRSQISERPQVYLMQDLEADLPDVVGANVRAFGGSRLKFIFASLFAGARSDILLLGHINLLPIGVVCKLLNPRLHLALFVHGVEVWNDLNFRRRRWYEPFLLRFLTVVASVSSYTADIMAQEFSVPRRKFLMLPNAVDHRPQTGNVVPRADSILVVSRMAEHDSAKNVDKVITAFAQFAKLKPVAVLEIVGDGVLRREMEEHASALGVSDQVVFHGRVSDEALDAAYARARLFVMPSDKEGFGIVFLEAWLRGLPVICGSRGASREIISDGVDGYVVDANDIALLASRMEFLLTEQDAAREMGQKGLVKVQASYLDENFRFNLWNIVGILQSGSARKLTQHDISS